MENNKADAVRIQTSVLNALEKKVLVWLAERQPRWITSDILTYIGRCVFRTLANVPSSESPYQLMMKPNELSHRKLIFHADRMYPAAMTTAPKVPIYVRMSEVIHLGWRCLHWSCTY